ncbi:MAG: Ig-like domain repeat protein [Solirubrobacterales bacterium]|nr:Ig-like domain repeat protein [Solirubrobacterales bacterium]
MHGVLDRGRLTASLVILLTALWSALAASPADAATVPTNNSPPTISGTPQQGQTLTEVNGSWANSPTSYSYQWERCDGAGKACTTIAAATGQTLQLTAADVGHTIVVEETATNAAGAGQPAPSAATGVVTTPTVTTVTTPTSAPVVNQAVTLIAAVTSSDSAVPPSGAVTFWDGGAAIAGCANAPVQNDVATCQTSFAASTALITAVFSPNAADLDDSSSPTLRLTVGAAATSTSVAVSPTVAVGAGTTYTATVQAPAGSLRPTGTVEFLDGGQAIASCRSQPLTNGSATCGVTYNVAGGHSIGAQYSGDANFLGSSAPAQPVSAVNPGSQNPLGPSAPGQVITVPGLSQVLGAISSTMQWTFLTTSTYTKVLRLVVNGASGDTVTTSCRGQGCAFLRRRTLVTSTKHCAQTSTRSCATHGAIDLTPAFHNRPLSPGAQVSVMITRPGWIGKYYQFAVRAQRRPRVQIACLAPGALRPGFGC